ncbi:MAG: hypothetical protein U0V74_02970 [Chitinophagales bacterium]
MTKFCFYALLLLTLSSCSQPVASIEPLKQPATFNAPVVLDSAGCAQFTICLKPITASYSAARNEVTQRRLGLNYLDTHYKSLMDTFADTFTELYLNNILPYWYGTPWAFSGYTAVPNKGDIACSYFVSTTLLHMGVPINRYKVAQQNPLNEARTYAIDDSLYQFNSAEMALIKMGTDEFAPGFYFVGLGDNHVGLLLKRRGEVFFLHSNYVDGKVVIEDASASAVFNSYATFYIVNLSYNNSFINCWLKQKPIQIKTN